MKRRELSLRLAGVAALAALGLRPGDAAAQGKFVEGKDYAALKTPVSLPRSGRVEVVEFFWYGCPHCFAFEPVLEPWAAQLPPDVHFRRVAYGFDEALREVHQRVYYTWEALDVVGTMHTRTFERFHTQHKPINTEADMLAFAGESGLDVAKVKAAWNGFSMPVKLRQVRDFCESYGVDFVPQIGVQGRYLTAPSMAGDGPKALAATDSLIALVRKGG